MLQRRLYDRFVPHGPAIRIAWLTDTHLLHRVNGDPDADGAHSGNRYFYSALEKLTTTVSAINALRPKPSLVLHTGDIIENYADTGPESIDDFLVEWARLNVAEKELTIGNHDLLGGSYQDLVDEFGYGDRDEIAGSKFNRSFSVGDPGFAVRMIMVDTNVLANGQHGWTIPGGVRLDALDWIEQEIDEADEDIILLCSHHGPHANADFLNRDALISLVESAIQANPRKRIWHLFGHLHNQTRVISYYQILGENYPGLLSPCLVDYVPVGRFTDLFVYPLSGRVLAAHSVVEAAS